MSDKKRVNQVDMLTQLSLPKNLSQNERVYYEKLHQKLPKIDTNQLTITGVDLNRSNRHTIKVTAFIRSTIEKSISVKPTKSFYLMLI